MSKASDDLFDLICEANRLPIAERSLTIRRLEEPLRHEVVGDGYRAKRQELLEAMTDAELPKDPDMTLSEIKARLRAAGVTFGNGTLNKSIWRAYCDLPAAFQNRTLEGA